MKVSMRDSSIIHNTRHRLIIHQQPVDEIQQKVYRQDLGNEHCKVGEMFVDYNDTKPKHYTLKPVVRHVVTLFVF